jgi:hypothetical protein
MASSRISPRARRFLAAHIHSVMQLELLLLVSRRAEDGCTAQEAAAELRAPVGWAETQLVDFAGQGVVAFDDGAGAARYRFDAAGPHARAVADVADAYARRRTSVIKLIFAAPARDVESFSDAFRLRDEEDD